MLHLTEDPRSAYAGPSDHDAVDAVPVAIFNGLLGGVNIPIAEDWDVHPRVVFDLGYQRPICLAFVHLRTCAAVNAYGLDANVLEAFGHLHDVHTIVVPAQSGLNRDRQGTRVNNFLGHGDHLRNVLQDARTGTTAGDLLYRATVVDVDDIRLSFLCDGRGLTHRIDLASKNLDAYGALVFENIQLRPALRGIANQSFRTDEFRVHNIGSVLLAQRAKRRIAHILHRSE